MRKSEMWRDGAMETVFKKPKSRHNRSTAIQPYPKTVKDTVGPFEQHTRGFYFFISHKMVIRISRFYNDSLLTLSGIGRRLMERHGWVDGLGLGSSQKGITKPIESDGQNPKERKGLGYFGQPLPLFTPAPSVKRFTSGVKIATIFDRPEETDPKETLLRSNQPTFMKFRH